MKKFFLLIILIFQVQILFSQTITLVKDIFPGTNWSFPYLLTPFNNEIYFAAKSDGVGYDLWKSDGTNAGTVLVKDFSLLPDSSYISDMKVAGNFLFISVYTVQYGHELWKSDGTTAGTVLVKDILTGTPSSEPRYLTMVGSEVFFTAVDGIHGRELWKSDGTAVGTVLVKDIEAGPGNPIGPLGLAELNNNLIFLDIDDSLWWNHGNKLWISDGTTTGTHIIRDIDPYNSSDVYGLTVIDSSFYFNADSAGHLEMLWKSDGTPAGTEFVHDFHDTSVTGATQQPRDYVKYNGATYLFTCMCGWVNGTGFVGSKLWKTDGTDTGTVFIFENVQNGNRGSIRELIPTNNSMFFYSQFMLPSLSSYYQLWKSDGTSTGNLLVKDFSSNRIEHLQSICNLLYFTVHDTLAGAELAQSDGTFSGTFMITDLNPGIADASPFWLTDYGNYILFSALDSIHGRELWRLDCNNVSVNEVKNNQSITISPNPTSTEFQISNFNFQKGDEIILTDVLGKIYFTKKISSPTSNFKLQTSNFTNGIYFLEVKTKEGVFNKKVVIQH